MEYSNYNLSFDDNYRPNNVYMDDNIQNNINTVSLQDVQAAYNDYLIRSQQYANAFVNYVTFKKYIEDRLMKDLSDSILDENNNHTIGAINLHQNTFVANIKADNYFNYAKSLQQNPQFTQTWQIENVASTVQTLVSEFFYSENNQGWNVSVNLPAVVYDNRAIVLEMKDLDSTVSAESKIAVFINDKPNASGINKTFTAYDANNQAEYTISYDNNRTVQNSENLFYRTWVIKNSSGNVIATTAPTVDEQPHLELNYTFIDNSTQNIESGTFEAI